MKITGFAIRIALVGVLCLTSLTLPARSDSVIADEEGLRDWECICFGWPFPPDYMFCQTGKCSFLQIATEAVGDCFGFFDAECSYWITGPTYDVQCWQWWEGCYDWQQVE
jgi:hypothetical protein